MPHQYQYQIILSNGSALTAEDSRPIEDLLAEFDDGGREGSNMLVATIGNNIVPLHQIMAVRQVGS